MTTASRLICDNIKNANLVPEDLLSNGIVYGDFLKKYYKPIFNVIENYNCINELYSYDSDIFQVELSIHKKEFISLRIKYGYASAPNLWDDNKKFYNALSSFLTQLEFVWKILFYQKELPDLNERSYTHQIVKQAKFSKDDWNHGLKYIQNYDVPEVRDIWDEFNYIMIHFYKTIMDIYVLDYEIKPFHRMVLVKSIELLLQKRNSNFAIQQVCSLCESLLFVNSLILENIRKIDLIDQLIPSGMPAIPRTEDIITEDGKQSLETEVCIPIKSHVFPKNYPEIKVSASFNPTRDRAYFRNKIL
ncbi:24103_t:CDS:2, partial [Dentiscutata erythropus]